MLYRAIPLTAAFLLAGAPSAHALSPVAPVADVNVSMTATDAQTVPSLGPAVSPVTYTATVANYGPDQATGIKLSVDLTGDQPVESVTPQDGTCETTGTVVTCDTAMIATGQSDTVTIRTAPASTSDIGARASATTVSTDPRLANNFAGVTPAVVVVDPQPPPLKDITAPDTNILLPRPRARAGAVRLFRGTATDIGTGVTGVEIAVQVVDRAACMSLVNSGGRFVPVPCSARKWLPATGTATWRYRLKRSLPRGRYRVYSRATDAAGQVERHWRRSDRNVVRFSVE